MHFKRMIMIAAAVAVGGVIVAEQARASAVPSLLMGTRAIDVSGKLDDNGEDVEVALQGKYGYFYQDFTQAGAYLRAAFRGSDSKALSAGAFVEYNVDLGRQVVPYVGGSLGLIWVDTEWDSDTAIEATGFGGARYFFVDYAAIGAELVIGLATEEIYNGGEDAVDWAINVNTSWYF